ncbi:MAG TPA: SAM-dependent DNA methyltransferase [candidate division WOR-3 bacterium]|uniref:SAM-dependent DNA methyltransferase n=1 Tax=candidate division WOR-3 bacterium TaxID=2052148 RepID=A0A9C9EN56_UNCW3|nr:SAM-dependent DNA methyltransferase [candidate division WOR-3 bacterium]
MRKRSKIRGKTTRIPSPFDEDVHKTERSAVAVLMHWMREIIEKEKIDLGLPDVEAGAKDRKFPDTVIYESRRSRKVICVIEAKLPYYDIFNYDGLKKPAWEKANARKSKYFAVTNFQVLIWYNTEKVNKMLAEESQIVEKFTLSDISDIDDIENSRYSTSAKKALEIFLKKLFSVYTGKEPEPKQPVDDFLVFRLQEKIKVLAKYYREIIRDECHKKKEFSHKLQKWFAEQGWDFLWQDSDFSKVARQTAYLLVNKILFYNVLQTKRPSQLDPLEVPESLTKGSTLQIILQGFFDQVLKIDYEQIYTTDFIDTLAFPDDKTVVEEIKNLVNILKAYDFSKLGYDVIGRIFERLIPQEERHNLGQYFTNPDVVDLILKFCHHHENFKILDPACGAGTFLVRAYKHKQLMNQMLKHEEILSTLWGVDIAKFPAHLSTINLAINDLSIDQNYPNIIIDDFFNLIVGYDGFEAKNWRKRRALTLGKEEREIFIPRWFDCVVGNPPYTRQEEIPDIGVDKEKLIKNALIFANKKIANISKRAGIYAYFFIHGTKFLKDGGYFGFVVSNSWLDVDYGKGLQEFFLKNYKIITIIESKIERWFEEADINTCIVILQKCKNKKERDENIVRFVYLKKPLRHFIPPAQDMWEKQLERLNAIDKLIRTILAHNSFYENEDLRIYPKSQEELWEEGFDEEQNKYVGAKWGKYIRAPEIFFKIVEKGKGKLVPLKEVAEVRFGIKTGANEFFYLTEEDIKKWGIEKEFWMHKDKKGKVLPNYVIKSPRECKSIITKPEDLKYRVLMVHKDKKDLKGTNVLKYIKWGERQGFHKRPTCASRKRWYDLGIWDKPDLIWSDAYNDRYAVYNPYNMWADKRFFYIHINDKKFIPLIHGYFNSSIIPLIIEMDGITNLGEGAVYTNVYQLKRMLVPSKTGRKINQKLTDLLISLSKRNVLSIFEEFGAETKERCFLNTIKPDRRELDEIIMGDFLGLSEEEQLEVYRAVIDLVKSRVKKAKSVKKKKKTKEGLDLDLFIKTIKDKIGKDTLGRFYRERVIKSKISTKTVTLPTKKGKVKIEHEIFGFKLGSGRKHIECKTEEEARYLKIFLEAGLDTVKIPKQEPDLRQILPELAKLKERIDKIISEHISTIANARLRAKLEHLIWQEMVK